MTDKFQAYAAIFQILNRAMLSSIPDNGWNTGLRLYEIIYFRFLSCRFVNQILSQFQPFGKKKPSRFRNMYFFHLNNILVKKCICMIQGRPSTNQIL